MKKSLQLSLCLAGLLITSISGEKLSAQTVPPLINYQGKLVSSNGLPVSTGDYELRFRIWDAPTGGNLIWGPQVFNGQSGSGFGPKVPVVQGWFNVMLGPVATNGVPIATAFLGTNRFMEIQLGTNAPFSPRQQILSTPYALRAEHAAAADTANFAASSSNLLGQATTGPITYYVSTSGVDTNDGLSTNTAKRTIQAAVDAVPNVLQHIVKIYVLPGTYRETVRIVGKRRLQALPTGANLMLIGMGISPTNVVVSGADANGTPQLPNVLNVEGSDANVFNMTFSQSTSYAVVAPNRSNLGLERCRIENSGGGFYLYGYSAGVIEDVIIQNAARGNYAIDVEQFSMLLARDDHTFGNDEYGVPGLPGDPGNTVHNTIRNWNVGMHVYSGSLIRYSSEGTIFDQVTTPTFAEDASTNILPF